jgi:hypothetical protein
MADSPIAVRTATRLGTPYLRFAKIMARQAQLAGIGTRQRFINGYLLRAIRGGSKYQAQVLDFPAYLWFSGPLRFDVTTEYTYNNVGLAVPVGNRDDFTPPGGQQEPLAVADMRTMLIVLVPTSKAPNEIEATNWHLRPYQDGAFMEQGYGMWPFSKRIPGLEEWYFDDMDYFTFDQICSVQCSLNLFANVSRAITFRDDGNADFGALALTYFLRNQFSFTEEDLPNSWKLAPRRLAQMEGSIYPTRQEPGDVMSGFAIAPGADDFTFVGTDTYCIAARTFRQNRQLWGGGDDPIGYDRYGEQGMVVSVATINRQEYDPRVGSNMFARIQSTRVIDGFDIVEEYLRPTPATRELTPGLTAPNYGVFNSPSPVRVRDGFVVFSVYFTERDVNPPGTENPDYDLIGNVTSLLFTDVEGKTSGLKADWEVPGITLPTGTPGQFTQPYIVGTLSLVEGEEIAAYCLAWESNYDRRGGQTTATGGNWALYCSTGTDVTRTAIEGGSHLIAARMYRSAGYPLRGDYTTVASAMYWMGGRKIVVAGTDNEPTNWDFGDVVIRPMVLDLDEMTITAGGEIATIQAQNASQKCFVTVAQQEQYSADGAVASPATLVASLVSDTLYNYGKGKTYISVDGGASWREYISDAGGQNGAFLEGNKLWRYDQNKPIT